MTNTDAQRGDRAAANALTRTGTPAGEWEPNVTAPATVRDAETGEPVMVVKRYLGDMAKLRRAFMDYPMSTTKRAIGIRNRSAVFGNVSRRVHMKREGCRACGGASTAPGPHHAILEAGANIFGQLRPDHEQAARDETLATNKIPADWRIPDTPWTSGVLNESSPLPYHYDRNNLPTWSAMIVARRNVDGGHLHIPEYDLVVECRDGDIVWFPGWHYVHGVTPLRLTKPDGYRYTAVYYTVRGMGDCLPAAEELRRARTGRSAREDVMLTRQAAEGLLDQ